jgi:hypothetical protein
VMQRHGVKTYPRLAWVGRAAASRYVVSPTTPPFPSLGPAFSATCIYRSDSITVHIIRTPLYRIAH